MPVAGLCLLLQACHFGDELGGTVNMEAGLARAQDGTLLVVVAACGGTVSSASVIGGPPGNGDQWITWNTWARGQEVAGVQVWPVSSDGNWKTGRPITPFRHGWEYGVSARGITADPHNSNLSTTLSFTAEDVPRLAPGQVRFAPLTADETPVTESMALFRAHPCPVARN